MGSRDGRPSAQVTNGAVLGGEWGATGSLITLPVSQRPMGWETRGREDRVGLACGRAGGAGRAPLTERDEVGEGSTEEEHAPPSWQPSPAPLCFHS